MSSAKRWKIWRMFTSYRIKTLSRMYMVRAGIGSIHRNINSSSRSKGRVWARRFLSNNETLRRYAHLTPCVSLHDSIFLEQAQLWNWLKRMGSHIFKEGINLTKISLPVCLFEPRSFLERLTTNWEYNSLLVAAARCTDPADRLRFIVAFAISGLCRQVSFHKPFNPILGETYQAVYPNGIEVYCEQISHHPPISSWEVYEPSGKFVFHGNGNWVAGIKGNNVKGRQTGINCVRFASDDAVVEYELPGLQVKGVLWGVRVLKYSGQMVFKDKKNGLQAVIDVDPPAPSAGFLSGWFRAKKGPPHKPDQVFGRLMQGDTVLDTCHGSWLHYLEWDKGLSPAAAPLDNPLPSDCRHREDVVYLKAGDQVQSQDWKQTLEEQQRRDRKLRKEGGCAFDH
ncbi:hypothetical protein VOLCADRAFT_108254 [Volvox carteri f. nagariensis]|uniref:Oxysterol-binding protein n=1 Tax=Volvox carteri f. nagariensis TaxID=3068 RepID=D8UJ52_VOLCA|nr:uncharacterized protein VOLCADRAFT_108254 [Volvox carteri f. nagariensis]EFJ40244.1 hypothetical protein VOLCADRAFT_108254 [Volvox carteri f. nagariensis]|eukprot:XP_002958684.1 hypothetical protein VOLCADRAFT_108254 [Volvox carteri f. nagariensis]